MSATHLLKSVGCVLAGFLTVAVLSVATDTLLEATGFFPPIGEGLFATHLLVIAFLYRSAYTVLGGYVTARLAPQNTMKHIRTLAILGTLGGIMGVVAGWNLSAHWYPIALAVTAFPLVWFGGTLKKN